MAIDLNDKREKVLGIVKDKGPLLPVQIAKEVETDIMFAGALLSELIANNKIKISSVKVGGSPLYYVEEQKEKLQDFIKNLNEKDQKTANLLKEKRVLEDVKCDSLTRVSLREIKDFAKPIQVKENGKIELFWKWYLIEDEEAEGLIKGVMGGKEEKIEEKQPSSEEPSLGKKLHQEKEKNIDEEKKEEIKEEIEKKIEKIKPKRKKISENIGLKAVNEFFNKNNINVLKADVIKKNKEINYVVEMNSNIGKLSFFVKFKDRKKVNDGDLSLALNEAKKMPLIVLATGGLTKKAEKLMENEFAGVIFRKL